MRAVRIDLIIAVILSWGWSLADNLIFFMEVNRHTDSEESTFFAFCKGWKWNDKLLATVDLYMIR